MSSVKNADVTVEYVRRLVHRLGYVEELPEECAKEGYVFGVATPSGEGFVYWTLAVARSWLRRDLKRRKTEGV